MGDSADNIEQVVSIFAQDMAYEQQTNRQQLSFSDILSGADLSLIMDLYKENETLVVLRVSDENCGLCVDTELEDIKKLHALLGDGKIVVFASFSNKRTLKLLTSGLENLRIPSLLIGPTKINLPIEEANIPYYFRIDLDGLISNVFIPKKSFPEYSEAYFHALNEIFSD